MVEVDGVTVYRTMKTAKRAAERGEQVEKTFAVIQASGDKGIITTELRKRVPFSNSVLTESLTELLKQNRVEVIHEAKNAKRYVASEFRRRRLENP